MPPRQQRVSRHAKLSVLEYLLTTLTHLRADDYEGMRHMTIKLS